MTLETLKTGMLELPVNTEQEMISCNHDFVLTQKLLLELKASSVPAGEIYP